MSRIYTVSANMTVTAAGTDVDLMTLLPASNKPIKLRGFTISNTSEVGDAQEEGVRLQVTRLTATVTNGSGGSASATPAPMDSADSAAGFSGRINDTTLATSSGSTTVLEELGWNERNTPYEHWYPDAAYCPKVKNGEALVIRQQTTLADDATFQLTAWVEEE